MSPHLSDWKHASCLSMMVYAAAYVSSRYLIMSELSNIATFWLGSCMGNTSSVMFISLTVGHWVAWQFSILLLCTHKNPLTWQNPDACHTNNICEDGSLHSAETPIVTRITNTPCKRNTSYSARLGSKSIYQDEGWWIDKCARQESNAAMHMHFNANKASTPSCARDLAYQSHGCCTEFSSLQCAK